MVNFCPRCGAQFSTEVLGEWIRANVKCPDCRLALTEEPAMLAPSDDEIGYELTDWPVTDRSAITTALIEADIPYRWEPALMLVVPASVEKPVDALLQSLAAEAPDATGDLPAEEGLEDAADGGEEAQAAMSDLFVAADRLQHAPFDPELGEDMVKATEAVGACLPPYGIEAPVWQKIQEQAAAIVGDLEEGADDDVVAGNTRALRDFLRDYV